MITKKEKEELLDLMSYVERIERLNVKLHIIYDLIFTKKSKSRR